MYPIILERDSNIIGFQTAVGWCQTDSDPAATVSVRTDGVLYVDYGVLDTRSPTGAVVAEKATCNGLHITQPEEGTDYTCYAISVACGSADPNLVPFLFIGQSDSITSSAAGDSIAEPRYIAWGDQTGAGGPSLTKEMVIAVPFFAAKNALCVGVGMIAQATAGNIDAFIHLSVRRLIGVAPAILDSRKLG